MRQVAVSIALLFSFLLCFCGKEKKAVAAPSAAAETDPPETATDSILKFWLGKQSVNSDSPFPNTLWFWTNWQELDSIDQQKTLLRTAIPQTRADKVCDQHLFDKKWDSHPVAGWLRSGALQRRRDAWPCYWAIIPAAPVDSFAPPNQLVQVVLEDSALVVVFRPDEKNAFQVFDMQGKIMPLPEAEKSRSRIAMIFLQSGSTSAGIFRSFYLCNEKMIRSWHHGVPGVQDKVAMDINYMMLLYAWLEAHREKAVLPGQPEAPLFWTGNPGKMSIAQLIGSTRRTAQREKEDLLHYTKTAIDHIRQSWRLQLHPMERYPSRGVR